MSPLIFNIYSEKAFNKALEGVKKDIIINVTTINNLRYADDTVLIASSLHGLQKLVNRVSDVCTKEDGLELEYTNKIKFLGYTLNDDSDTLSAFASNKPELFSFAWEILRENNRSLKLCIRILRCYMFFVLLYDVKAWTLTEATTKRLKAWNVALPLALYAPYSLD